ncbi:hypothetical protein, partial [Komagataeibacter xylinus]|uniref:hypothetical protein n=1 Tax=Komagataeibacter xylinus TaxID=28448 RepID=UPI0039EB6131
TLFNIKETRLLHIAIPSINAEEIESYRRPQNQGVFRTLQVTDGLIRSWRADDCVPAPQPLRPFATLRR